MDIARRWAIAVLFSVAIPAIGYVVSWWIISDTNAELLAGGLPTFQEICADPAMWTDDEIRSACSELAQVEALQTGSLIAAIMPLGLLALYLLCSLVAGSRRALLAGIFPGLIGLSLVVIALTVLLQGASWFSPRIWAKPTRSDVSISI